MYTRDIYTYVYKCVCEEVSFAIFLQHRPMYHNPFNDHRHMYTAIDYYNKRQYNGVTHDGEHIYCYCIYTSNQLNYITTKMFFVVQSRSYLFF